MRWIRPLAVLVAVVTIWTAVVIRWGNMAGIWTPDDPYDPGAVMAAQFSGMFFSALVWLVGLVFIGIFGVCIWTLARQIRR